MPDVECVVVGAGVIGLAIARQLALNGREVVVLERERQFGMHTSSRNSEVIHAGIHYAPNSLKARLCVAGRDLLYGYCAAHAIEHRRCGKLTVASSEAQFAQLEHIDANARASGVTDLKWLDGEAARRLEPELVCAAALSSPSTGIIDSHAYLQSLLGDAENHGATIAYGTAVSAVKPTPQGLEIYVDGGAECAARARWLVNSAGLHAHEVAACIADFPRAFIPAIHYAKGNYFSLQGRSPFKRLIYPPGDLGWLGIHMTLDLGGGARFGPDLQWVDAVEYSVDAGRCAVFYEAIRRYWPQLPDNRLIPAYCGIRPKLSGPGQPARDFAICGPAEHGVAGVVNLFGMESPGLTASLAVGEYVAALVAC